MNFMTMTRVQHYKGLQTNIDNLFNSIKDELQNEKNLKLVSEIKGEMNGRPLRSITAINKSLIVLAGALREITVSIIGNSDDFAIEVASGSWFESLLIPGVTGFLVGGPLGAVGGTTVGVIMAYEFERKIWKKINEVVQKESKKQVTTENIDHYNK
jgi:hypothetical protein